MKKSTNQYIAICSVLLFQFALYASMAHAMEHPFHTETKFCSSFINFAKHDVSLDTALASIELTVFSIETVAEHSQTVVVSFLSAYSSRAPPVS